MLTFISTRFPVLKRTKKILDQGFLPSIVEMDHDLWLGAKPRVFDTPGGATQQACDVSPVVGSSCRPQQARCDLIADGDDGWLNAGILESVARFQGVVVQLPRKIVDVGRPSGGDTLLARVGPSVAVMEVDVHTEPDSFRPSRKLDVVIHVVLAIAGVDPYTLPNSIHAILNQDSFEGLGVAVDILERHAGPLLNEKRRPVHTFVGDGGVHSWKPSQKQS